MTFRTLIAGSLLSLFVLFTGCGDKGPGLIPVTGKVTFGGAAPPKAGNVNFNPVEPAAGYPRLNGTAEFGADGTFTVKSSGDKMGLVPGKYVVSIECWEEMPSMETMKPGKSYVPGTFQSPTIEIAVGEKKKEVTIDVPKG
jgi:predicted small lipoprotein YifL